MHPIHRVALLCIVAASFCLTGRASGETIDADLLIVGATESGWAAAIQAARMGTKNIVIVHDGVWFGGQFTEQALACVDENKGVGKVGWGPAWHPMKRSFHRSGLFKELMDRIEAHNAEKYGDPHPGRPWHGPTTFRPAEAEAIFRAMIQPYVDSGQVRVFWQRYPSGATVERRDGRSVVRGIDFAPVDGAAADVGKLSVRARLTIDASDWGEAIQVAGVGYACGPTYRDELNEPSAPTDRAVFPRNEMNPLTWCMIIEDAGRDALIDEPARYDDRNYYRATRLTPSVKSLKWDRPIRRAGGIQHWPDKGKVSGRQLSVYTVRRVVDGHAVYAKGEPSAILLCYMLGQDYPLERLPRHVADALEATEPGASKKNIVEMTRAQRRIVFADAQQHALGVLRHMQTTVHDRAKDKTHSFRRFKLSGEFPTSNGLPPKPYIRESLRLKAMYTMREQDGRNTDGKTKRDAEEKFAHVMYDDGIGCWQFHYDFHRTGRTYLQGDAAASGPWVDYEKAGRNTHIVSDRSLLPLRALIPAETDGLIGAQKNVGYTSMVSAAIRLHDQCIAIGQAAGATASVALREDMPPRAIVYDRAMLDSVRDGLCGGTDGVPLLLWPFRDLPAHGKGFVAVNRLAMQGCLPMRRDDVDFNPDAPATPQWRKQVAELSLRNRATDKTLVPPTDKMSRAEFARQWWAKIKHLPQAPHLRASDNDADGDGVNDADDPLLFTNGVATWR